MVQFVWVLAGRALHGVAVGEMQQILMRKIEELTLYVIELSKSNHDLKSELEEVKQGLKR